MKTFTFILVETDGSSNFPESRSRVLYSTTDDNHATRLAEYIEQDWNGTREKFEVTRGRSNAQGIVALAVDDIHQAWCDGGMEPRNGMRPSRVEAGQSWGTIAQAAAHLGVTAPTIIKSLAAARSRVSSETEVAVTRVRGVTLAYSSDYDRACRASAETSVVQVDNQRRRPVTPGDFLQLARAWAEAVKRAGGNLPDVVRIAFEGRARELGITLADLEGLA